MFRQTILVLALSCAWPVTQALPRPAPLPVQSVQHVEQLIAEKQLDNATKAIKDLIKKDPGNAKMHYYLAQIYAANGNWVDAGAMLKKAKYFDWRLQFASSKQRVAEFEQLIEARKAKLYTDPRTTAAYHEFILSEKHSYAPSPSLAAAPAVLTKATEQVAQVEMPRHRSTLWFLALTLGLVGGILVVMVRRFNIQNTHRDTRLAEAAIKEQKIVLFDLMRVLNDVEAITKSENLSNLHGEISALLERVYSLVSKLEEDELQNIEDIEQYVRKTQLYRRYCNNFQDLPPVALS